MLAFYQDQLRYVAWIQEWRTPWLDAVMGKIHHMDSLGYYLLLALVVLYGWGPRLGIRALYGLAFIAGANAILKSIFQHPRPFVLDPAVGLSVTESTYGLPSGAATAAVVLGFIIFMAVRGKLGAFLGFTYVAVLSFSRVYLGVHFPTDIFAGWAIGLATVGAYFVVEPLLTWWLDRFAVWGRLVVSALLVTVLLTPFLAYRSGSYYALAMGVVVGSYLYERFAPDAGAPRGLARKVLAIVAGLAAFLLLSKLGRFGLFAAGAWFAGGSVILFSALDKSADQRSPGLQRLL